MLGMTTSNRNARQIAERGSKAHYIEDVRFPARFLICSCGERIEGDPATLDRLFRAHRRDLGLSNPGMADALGGRCRTAAERAAG